MASDDLVRRVPTDPIAEKYKADNSKVEYPDGFVLIGPHRYVYPADRAVNYGEILDFEVRRDDVFIAGFPRSGATWLEEMVWLIVNNMNFDEAGKTFCQTRVPYLGTFKVRSSPDYQKILEGLPSPRIIKVHQPYNYLPREIYFKKPKVLYIRRDAKDVCVSCFHHETSMRGYTGTIDDFVDAFISDNVIHGPYWAFIKSYFEVRSKPHLLSLTYEEMKQDLPSCIRKVAKFLGKAISANDIVRLEQHLSFESMKANPSVNLLNLKPMLEKKFNKEYKGDFLRKGEVGSGQIELSAENNAKLDEWIQDKDRFHWNRDY